MAHTPGPWEWSGTCLPWALHGPNYERVIEACQDYDMDAMLIENDDDFYLIKAAPDLLAALKNWFNTPGNNRDVSWRS